MFYSSSHLSDEILTISEYSKNEICNRLDIKKEKVKVIYLGNLNKEYSKQFKKDYKFKNILFVGSLFEHKNVMSLIKAIKYFMIKK